MLLQDIISFLTEAGVVEGYGIDAFADFQPEKPDRLVVFQEYAGSPISPVFELVNRSVQCKCRGASAEDSKELAENVFRALRPSSEDSRVDLTSERFCQIYPRQTPFKLDQDEKGRVIYCFNFGITTLPY